MRSLLRLLVTVILLGAAMQQGWLQAAIGLVGLNVSAVPSPRMEPLPRVAGLVDGTIGSLAGTIRRRLPDPWYSLALMIAGVDRGDLRCLRSSTDRGEWP